MFKMKIGIDASRAFVDQPTGTENYSLNLLTALSKIDKKNYYRVYTKDTISEIQETKNLPDNFKFVPIKLPRFWTQVGLAAETWINPVDVLFIPAHTLPILRRPNLKTVVTIHDLGAEFLPGAHTIPDKLYLTWSTKYALRNATAIIAVSEATKKDLVEKYHCDPAKIFVVAEGVDVDKFRIENSELRIKKILGKYKITKPYLLFVGTLQPRKNLVRLIEAFSRIVDNSTFRIQNLQLVIVGKKGWLFDEILAAPEKFKVGQKVKFLDYVEDFDLPTIYSGAQIFVLPSLIEGFGLPILEAMAAGVPVVCSETSSLPEVGGDAALYFNPENTQEIEKAILKVFNDQKLRQDLINKGYEQVEKFSWEKCAKETLTIFKKVVYDE